MILYIKNSNLIFASWNHLAVLGSPKDPFELENSFAMKISAISKDEQKCYCGLLLAFITGRNVSLRH